jgi:hypothetical protein
MIALAIMLVSLSRFVGPAYGDEPLKTRPGDIPELARGADLTAGAVVAAIPKGDTLTVIQRPLLNIPAIVRPGDTLTIQCDAHPTAFDWSAEILRNHIAVPLGIADTTYDTGTLLWELSTVLPEDLPHGLYDLVVNATRAARDTTRHAVQVIPEFKDDYYFIHITDTHLPTHLYYYQTGARTDTSEITDLREVIADINIINPEFVLLTGDLVNEGELEDFLDARYYTRAQRLLTEFEVPVFLTAGNHDIGGWSSTPPPAGTARRDWWRFFGWKWLASPPPGSPWYTQNYSFDYGPVHYVGLEAYDNYDRWRFEIYGRDSFTSGQMQWLAEDLAEAAGSAAQVLFYHYDFSRQINLNALGVEMALWGHIHRNDGNINSQPYNLATNNLCDGERSYRLVRVSGSTLTPSPTISAGYDGNDLAVEFEPANDGTHLDVSAYVTNDHYERFEHAMVRFRLPGVSGDVEVTGGKLMRIEDMGQFATYCVGVDIQPLASQQVRVKIDSTASPDTGDVASDLWLGPNHPNPFGPQTVLSFTLPRSGKIRLTVFDIHGRLVAVLVDRYLDAGPHSARWNGLDSNSRPVSPGVYFARLSQGAEARSRKLVLTR